MITQLLVSALAFVLNGLLGLFPSVPVPDWMGSPSGLFSQLVGYGASMGVWIPWSLLLTVSAVVLSCVLAGFVIKVVRIVASFVTLGGGSAA